MTIKNKSEITELLKTKSIKNISVYLNISQLTIYRFIKNNNIKNIIKKQNSYNYNNIFLHDTEESLYIAGFIAADGCVSGNSGNCLEIGLAQKDKLFLQKINSYITNRSVSDKLVTKSCLMVVSNKEITKTLFEKFNITPNKSLTYSIPTWVLNHKLAHHFLRGYVDGDGCWKQSLNKNNHIQIYFKNSGTKIVMEQFLETFRKNINYEIKKYKIIQKQKNIYRLEFGGNCICSKICNYLYKDATIYLDRKRNIAMLAESNIVKNIQITKKKILTRHFLNIKMA